MYTSYDDFMKNSVAGNKIMARQKIKQQLIRGIKQAVEPLQENFQNQLMAMIEQMNEALLTLDERVARLESDETEQKFFGTNRGMNSRFQQSKQMSNGSSVGPSEFFKEQG